MFCCIEVCAAVSVVSYLLKTAITNWVSYVWIVTISIFIIIIFNVSLCNGHFCLYTGCNVIPLPPKDPRAVQQLTASKPRHQRKYPLVMPNSSSGSNCQMAATVSNSEQQLFCNQIIDCCSELLCIIIIINKKK